MIRSIHGRLIAALSACGTLVLICMCMAMYWGIQRTLLRQFDEALLAKAQAVAAMSEQNAGAVTFDFDAESMGDFFDDGQEKGNRAFFEITLDNGSVLGRSPSLGEGHLAAPAGMSREPEFQYVTLPGGGTGRSVAYRFSPVVETADALKHPGENAHPRMATIVAAQETLTLQETLWSILRRLAAVGAAALALSAGLTYGIIRRSLRPLRALAAGIDALAEPGQRIALEHSPRELEAVVGTLNGLLERVDAAMGRERAFTADVAHELRTPLAALRTTLEVCQSRQRGAGEYEAVIAKCRDLGDHLQSLIETLLLLARADAGQLAAQPQRIDIVERMDEWLIAFEGRAAERKLTIRRAMPARAEVTSDPVLLEVIINNLLDNAVSYCNEGGTIDICGKITEAGFELRVCNTGCALSPEDAGHVFDRFWRGDRARSDVRRHHGLGLALSRKAAELLGHRLAAEIGLTGQFRMTLTL